MAQHLAKFVGFTSILFLIQSSLAPSALPTSNIHNLLPLMTKPRE